MAGRRSGSIRVVGRGIVFAAIVAVGGCAILADPANYRGWDYRQFNQFKTFPNQPLCGVPGADAARCVAADPALDTADLPPRALASSRVLWAVNSECRNHAPRRADGRVPGRNEVLASCSAGGNGTWPADENFISLSISGGGNRSAVFGAEAMFVLEQWGLLDHVDVISGVSGGGFPAALYSMSCDADGDGAFCDEAERGTRVRWQYDTIAPRIGANLGSEFSARRYSPDDIFGRFATHRTTLNLLSETLADTLLYQANGDTDVRFADLNPRRPNLVLNATNVSIDRQYLEAEAGIAPDNCRLGHLGDRSHFAFTDVYFERLLRSDLSRLPLAYAAAASAAFPVIIDLATFGRFSPYAYRPDVAAIDFVHLTDGSIHDNSGIAEIEIMLRDIFERCGQPVGPVPRRVLMVVLDSTLNEATGVSRVDPDPRTIEAMIWPLRFLNTSRAVGILLATATALRLERLEEFLDGSVRRDCDPHLGPMSNQAVCADVVTVGVEMLDGYDSILADGSFVACDDAKAFEQANDEKRTQCEVMRQLKSPEIRARLGLGDYHPQCYFEATRFAPTSFNHDPQAAICLRHAARWAAAIRMAELCRDQRFGGAGVPGSRLAFGVDCSLDLPSLPALPECPYEAIIRDRSWTDIPRQTAHCACADPETCQPERLADAAAAP
jgi:hypothetical protein